MQEEAAQEAVQEQPPFEPEPELTMAQVGRTVSDIRYVIRHKSDGPIDPKMGYGLNDSMDIVTD